MTIRTLPVGELAANCYVIADDNGTAVVIDPGADAAVIRRVLDEEHVRDGAILLTHAHFDHIGAVKALSEAGFPVYCHTRDIPALQDGRLNLSAWFGTPLAPIHDAIAVEEGDELTFGGLTVSVLHTPGHTVGCVCYRIGDALFSGDTLFFESIGRTDFPGGDLSVMRRSLSRLTSLEDSLTVYPGHGEATTVAHERLHNPYIR